MRLIDADKFRGRIAAAAFLNRTEIVAERANLFMKLLDGEETAYDVDKVVEQIKQQDNVCTGCRHTDECKFCAIGERINIIRCGGLVKNGGEDD